MTAAYVLMINMFIAGIFAVAFAVIAATIPTSRGARWIAGGYATGILFALLEFIAPGQRDPLLVSILSYITTLLAMSFCLVGVSQHYNVRTPDRFIAGVWAVALVACPYLVSQYSHSDVAAVLYHLNYVLLQLMCGAVILRSRRRHPLDLLLVGMLVVSALTYLARPVIGAFVGKPESSHVYLETTYAAISMTLGAVTLIGLALVMLLVMMRQSTEEMMLRSQTDVLSGVLNRRGFDEQATRLLEQAESSGMPIVAIAADLDHFKQINDTYGHDSGDQVIKGFAEVLKDVAEEPAIIGRIGGEEFAVLIGAANIAMGRLYAESARQAISARLDMGIDRSVTASFGVAQLRAGETLSDLLRRADAALYDAKAGGRNCVRAAAVQTAGASRAAAARLSGCDVARQG